MKLKQLRKNLNNITENGGTNSKQFWNLVRSMRRNNTEDMYAITTEYGQRFFSEHDIKGPTAMYYQNLYTRKILPEHNHSWINFIEKQITILEKTILTRNTTTEKSPYKKLEKLHKPLKIIKVQGQS